MVAIARWVMLSQLAVPVSAQAAAPDAPAVGVDSLDEVMTAFMETHGIPGGALAVSKSGRLVYDRGFGFADVEAETRVESGALFRIASISKPVTAVAILQIVERGELALDDRVTSILDVAQFDGSQPSDARWSDVTIRHLLEHSGGWDRDESFDPMFRSHRISRAAGHDGPAGPRDIIRYMANQPLDFDPGARYAYSNFGYCLLGRVIEQVTGMTYADFVHDSVLAPAGITDMHIGASRLAGRRDNEVRYYAPPRRVRSVFPDQPSTEITPTYGAFNLEAMDSHGAWIASARDLVRFACALEGESALLDEESIAMMLAPPSYVEGDEKRAYYGLGWSVAADGSHNHGGSLPGTATRLVRGAGGGVNYAFLFNARHDGDGKRVRTGDLDRDLRRTLAAIKSWPATDPPRARGR